MVGGAPAPLKRGSPRGRESGRGEAISVMTSTATVFVVDGDPRSRDVVAAAARSIGLRTSTFSTPEQFVEGRRDEPGCVVVELRLPGAGGVELLNELRRRGLGTPVIMVAADADTAAVVDAMKAGAVTVLEKPLDDARVREAIREGLALDEQQRARRREQAEFRSRLRTLTDKERDVLRLLMEGLANKAMATELGASLRTIENRRRNLFAKLGVQSVAEMVTRVIKADEVA